MGNVTAFELCADGVGGSINVGNLIGAADFEVGLKKQNARAVINIRIVNATTREVFHSFVSEGTASSVSGSLNEAEVFYMEGTSYREHQRKEKHKTTANCGQTDQNRAL